MPARFSHNSSASRRWRWLPAGGAIAAGLAVAALSLPTASLGATTPRCTAANLRLATVRVLGAAGGRDWDFALRNVSAQTCHLYGYPGVGLLDRHARLMPVTVLRHPGAKTLVVLRPWQQSFFTLHYESNGPCQTGVFPTGLQVIPPGETHGLRLYAPFGICGGSRPEVTPIRARLGNL